MDKREVKRTMKVVKRWLRARCIPHRELAEHIGRDASAISNYCAGRIIPPDDVMEKILEFIRERGGGIADEQ